MSIQEISAQLFTIEDYTRWAASEFNRADLYFGHGTDNAWDEAKVLVMFCVDLPLALFEQVKGTRLTLAEIEEVMQTIGLRIEQQLPAAYITNHATFAGLDFYVNEHVLVPRSPIAELIDNKFADQLTSSESPKRILDLCTGSGCIAIACAYAFPEAEVDALDISVDALNVAQTNIEGHGLLEQVIPIQSDVFSSIPEQKYDLIVTNPPYVDQEDVDALPAEYQYEPEQGLGCGHDGLDIVRDILAQSASHLNEQGVLICEVGNSQVHVMAEYPEVDFNWLTFERGGHGVFMLTKAQLEQHASIFQQRTITR